MNTSVIVLLATMAVAAVADTDFIPVLRRSEVRKDTGEFELSYETGNGIVFEERGVLKPTADGKDKVLVKSGGYSYTSPEGSTIQLTYNADEAGFSPSGRHIPTPVQSLPPVF